VRTSKALCDLLCLINTVRFFAESQSDTGWSGVGDGSVIVESSQPDVVVFRESGKWVPLRGKATRFSNIFRWTILTDTVVRLEHLRFGEENPVHLFDLEAQHDGIWRPNIPHLCSEDCYSATLELHESGVNAQWAIKGPKKNETICYEYR
jgi:hypothetical protein